MSNAFTRSWDVTKATFHVMRQDKELLAYPLLSGFFSSLFILVVFLPIVILLYVNNTSQIALIEYVALFIMYFGLAIIAVFFNTCVVYTAKTRFEKGNATISSSVRFAFSRFGAIVKWALVSATVGLILRILENLARDKKGIGGVISRIVISMLGMAWNIVTVFVVPSIVYKHSNPKDAIQDSFAALKKTWGESLVRYFGLGLIEFVAVIISIILAIPLVLLAIGSGSVALFVGVLVAIIFWLVFLGLVFGIATTIFNTALYVYATTGKIPQGYAPEIVKNAFKKEK